MQHRSLLRWLMLGCILCIGLCFSSCTEEEDGPVPTEKTLFMYFPWSNNLTGYFRDNVADMETAISRRGLRGERVLVFFSTSSDEAELYEITCRNGKCERTVLKNYTAPAITTAEGITSILNDVKRFAPAPTYAMTIGCHGMGWVPVEAGRSRVASDFKYHWETEDGPLTRFFGGTVEDYQTNVTTLAEAIANAGMHMDFILFDDCYMATVEVAYDLRHVTDCLIASTCEMMAVGMPYDVIGGYLLESDYQSVCDGFYDFYSVYSTPCGTLSVTDCSQLDTMAELMREINSRYTYTGRAEDELQDLDGYRPTIFYDFADYVRHLCKDDALLAEYEALLARTVIYEVHTDEYFTVLSSAGTDGRGTYPIYTTCGLTISDPSTGHPKATVTQKENTAWWKATHD